MKKALLFTLLSLSSVVSHAEGLNDVMNQYFGLKIFIGADGRGGVRTMHLGVGQNGGYEVRCEGAPWEHEQVAVIRHYPHVQLNSSFTDMTEGKELSRMKMSPETACLDLRASLSGINNSNSMKISIKNAGEFSVQKGT